MYRRIKSKMKACKVTCVWHKQGIIRTSPQRLGDNTFTFVILLRKLEMASDCRAERFAFQKVGT